MGHFWQFPTQIISTEEVWAPNSRSAALKLRLYCLLIEECVETGTPRILVQALSETSLTGPKWSHLVPWSWTQVSVGQECRPRGHERVGQGLPKNQREKEWNGLQTPRQETSGRGQGGM